MRKNGPDAEKYSRFRMGRCVFAWLREGSRAATLPDAEEYSQACVNLPVFLGFWEGWRVGRRGTPETV